MRYTITLVGNAIYINGSIGITGNFTAKIEVNDIIIYQYGKPIQRMPWIDIISVGGDSAADNISDVLAQIIGLQTSSGSGGGVTITITENSNTLTDDRIIGTVIALIINDTTINTGFTQDGTSITFINDNTFSINQIVTVIFG